MTEQRIISFGKEILPEDFCCKDPSASKCMLAPDRDNFRKRGWDVGFEMHEVGDTAMREIA